MRKTYFRSSSILKYNDVEKFERTFSTASLVAYLENFKLLVVAYVPTYFEKALWLAEIERLTQVFVFLQIECEIDCDDYEPFTTTNLLGAFVTVEITAQICLFVRYILWIAKRRFKLRIWQHWVHVLICLKNIWEHIVEVLQASLMRFLL